MDVEAARAERWQASGAALGAMLGLANPVIGTLASVLPALSSDSPSGDAPAEYPDPLIILTYHRDGIRTTVRSAVVFDSVRPSWRWSTYVDLDRLDEQGIDIDIVDFDNRDSPRIGGVSLSKRELAKAASGSPRDLIRSDRELEEIRLRLAHVRTVAEPARWSQHTLRLQNGLVRSGVEVAANALVTVKVHGEGGVAGGGLLSCARTGHVTPAGLADGQCRAYNLRHDSTRTAPHGSAVVLVGADQIRAVSLATGETPEPCVQFLAPAGGEIVLGINDSEPNNNTGTFEFEMSVTPPPDDAAWLEDGPASCPD